MDFDNLKLFIKGPAFKKNLKWFAIGFVCFLVLITLFLRLYTRHGSSRAVPDLRGMTISEITQILEDKGLAYQISDSIYDKSVAPGCVVEQNPKAGSLVKKNRTIFVILNAANPEKIKMPNLVGVSLRQATSTIETAGLEIGNLSYVPDIAENNVLAQKFRGRDIPENEMIAKGSRIDLVLGKGLGQGSVQVPSVIGLSVMKARQVLTGALLNTGVVDYDKTIARSADSLKAVVYKQKPAGGTLSPGGYIDLWLTTDKDKINAAGKAANPTDDSESLYE
jgi:eukaryotic-like serine/threonine-protein kinase